MLDSPDTVVHADEAVRTSPPPDDTQATPPDSRARVDDDFYLRAVRQADEDDAAASAPVTRATAIMLAAANLNTRLLHDQFRERQAHPFRADTEEHGVDMPLIRREVAHARKSLLARDFFLLAVLLAGAGAMMSASAQEAPDPFTAAAAFFPYFAIMAAVVFAHRVRAKSRVREIFRQAGPANGVYRARSENVTISGGYSPFVGAGTEITGWSMTINLAKPDNDTREPKPVSVAELYRETEQDLRHLQIPGLELKDELFIDGRDVREVPTLFDSSLRSGPKIAVADAELDALVRSNNAKIRHYRVIRAQLWGGQVVLSTYLKYVKSADTLFVETRMRVLAPLAEKFAAHESLPITGSVMDTLNDAARSIALATVAWIPPLISTVQFIYGGFLELMVDPKARSRKAIRNDRRYNFGWPESLREKWSSESFERYFQMVDNDFHTKMIKETLLDSLNKSLEQRNICTTNLSEATTKIFNDGVILTGGAINTKSLAVGKGAQSEITSIRTASESRRKDAK